MNLTQTKKNPQKTISTKENFYIPCQKISLLLSPPPPQKIAYKLSPLITKYTSMNIVFHIKCLYIQCMLFFFKFLFKSI